MAAGCDAGGLELRHDFWLQVLHLSLMKTLALALPVLFVFVVTSDTPTTTYTQAVALRPCGWRNTCNGGLYASG